MSMENSYHYIMLINQSTYQKLVYDGLDGLGLSMGQPKILDFLCGHNGCMQKEIAAGCFIEPATVTSILLKMENDGYITRKAKDGNRRSLYVFLTDKGLSAAEKVREVMREAEEQALSCLSESERDTLLALMKKVTEGLRKIRV